MTTEEWLKSNYLIVQDPYLGESIYWGNGMIYYGIVTPLDKFVEMFGEPIQEALDAGGDVKQAIRDSDPENLKGFHEYL